MTRARHAFDGWLAPPRVLAGPRSAMRSLFVTGWRLPPIMRWIVALLALHVQASTAADVLVLRGGDAPVHHAAIEGLRETLPPAVRLRVVSAGDPSESAADVRARAVIAVGTAALEQALDNGDERPLFSVLVPRRTVAAYRATATAAAARPFAALFLDQPIDRQARVARALFPSLERLGAALPIGLEPAAFADTPETLNGMEVVNPAPGEAPLQAVTRLRGRVDAVLAVPDPRLYRSETVHGILLASYRANMPIIGYSRSMVQAGALTSAWLGPHEHGEVAGRMLAPYLERTRQGWPESGYTNVFRIAVNDQVARSLGLRRAVEVEDRRFRAGEPIE